MLLLLAFLAGVGLASFWQTEFFYWYGAALVLLVLLAAFWPRPRLRLALALLLFFALGFSRFLLALPGSAGSDSLRFYHGQTLTLTGWVAAEPEVTATKQRLTVKIASPSGKLLLNAAPAKKFHYGDVLRFSCVLEKPWSGGEFAYDKYLARYDIYTVCAPAFEIEETGARAGNPAMAAILRFKENFSGLVGANLPEPQNALLQGILLGSRSSLPPYLLTDFNRVGLTHIIAVSGTNITIIAGIMLAILGFFGVGRKSSFTAITLGIIFFVLLTGASASVARAGIMGILALIAFNLGRLSRAANAIVLAAFLMVLYNPKILVFDLGFQLSFLSLLGLIFLQPILRQKLRFLPRFFALRDIIAATLAATIATAPLLLYEFGRLSLIAPLANILVLPIIPLLMILGMAASALTFLFGLAGQIIFWPIWLLLEYIIRVSSELSSLPFSTWEGGGISPILLFAVYGLLAWCAFLLRRRQKYEHQTG